MYMQDKEKVIQQFFIYEPKCEKILTILWTKVICINNVGNLVN